LPSARRADDERWSIWRRRNGAMRRKSAKRRWEQPACRSKCSRRAHEHRRPFRGRFPPRTARCTRLRGSRGRRPRARSRTSRRSRVTRVTERATRARQHRWWFGVPRCGRRRRSLVRAGRPRWARSSRPIRAIYGQRPAFSRCALNLCCVCVAHGQHPFLDPFRHLVYPMGSFCESPPCGVPRSECFGPPAALRARFAVHSLVRRAILSMGSQLTWSQIRSSDEFRGRWVALDNCRYDARTAQPAEGTVVDADEDLVELCSRMQESENRHCAIVFCEDEPEPSTSPPPSVRAPQPSRPYTH
jgi:hypothetical protein